LSGSGFSPEQTFAITIGFFVPVETTEQLFLKLFIRALDFRSDWRSFLNGGSPREEGSER